jgi:uncharacterized membrane protein YraQ (UPF0718 family)
MIAVAVVVVLFFVNRSIAEKVAGISFSSMKQMLIVIIPIFVLLGLMDIWVPREMMIMYMGEGSGMKGMLFAFLIGSFAAGPLYGAFPVAAILMKKGAKFSNVLIFIGAWSTTKVPMLLFEISALGQKFAITRLLVDIPGIIVIAALINRLLKPREIETIYQQAIQIDDYPMQIKTQKEKGE